MTPFPALSSYSPPLSDVTVNVLSQECVGPELRPAYAGFTSAAWTQNRVIAIPLVVQRPYQVKQFFWYNGATVNGNTDVAIYNEGAMAKVGNGTGSTANSGTSVIQVVDVADFVLAANTRYWLALSSDSATQTYQRMNPSAVLMDWISIREQLSGWSSGLPASLTLAVPTVAYLPFFGFGRSVA